MDINTLIKQLVSYQHKHGNTEVELGSERGYADIEEVYFEPDGETVVIQQMDGF